MMRTNNPMIRQRGFTLLEAMVAVSLLAMLGLAAALTLNSSVRSEQIVGGSIDQLQRLQRAQQWLRRDLEQIVARQGRTEQGDPRTEMLIAGASSASDEDGVVLDFYKSGRRILTTRPPSSHLERVRYRLDAGRLLRDSSPYLEAPAGDRWHSALLMDGVIAVRLGFFYDQQWSDQWPPLQSTGAAASAGLPRALQLILETERYGAVAQILLLSEAP